MSCAETQQSLSRYEEEASEVGIDGLLARVATPQQVATLVSGRQVQVGERDGLDYVEVTSASGDIELSVRFTPEGPVLSLRAVKLALSAQTLDLRCARLQVEATERIETTSGGDIVTIAKGELRQRAFEDLSIDGKNVLINC